MPSIPQEPSPVKLCECGCGQPAPIAKFTNQRNGAIAGQPRRFAHGHNWRGKERAYQHRADADKIAEFWALVDKSAGPNACWPWLGKYGGTEYGQFSWQGYSVGAHRLAYQLTHGPIPHGQFICHRCDHPACCNPAHLFMGTPSDNMRDRDAKERHAHGETHGMARLTEAAVRAMRQEHAAGTSRHELARRYGVSAYTVWSIVTGRSWKLVK